MSPSSTRVNQQEATIKEGITLTSAHWKPEDNGVKLAELRARIHMQKGEGSQFLFVETHNHFEKFS